MNILVKGQIKSLTITDSNSNCELTQDLIGNADGFDGYDNDQELYVMTMDSYIWWSNYLNIEQDLQNRIINIKLNLDNEAKCKFEQDLIDAGDSDYEIMQMNIMHIIEQYDALN